MARTPRAAVVVALALVALAPLASHAGRGAPTGDDLASCPTARLRADGWARIAAPTYSPTQGEAGIAAMAVPAGLAKRVYVSNGTVVKTSQSAGCKWDHIYPGRTVVSVPTEVSRMVISDLVAPNDRELWLAGYEDSGGVPRPHVAKSADATFAAGNTTKEPITYHDDGLPAVGRPIDLALPRRTERAYLLTEEPADAESATVLATTRHLYRLTTDDELEPVTGAKRLLWEKVTTLPDALRALDGIAASPRQTDTVWAWSGRTYAWSRDAGTTWRTGTMPGEITTIDVDEVGAAAVFSRAADGGLMRRVEYLEGKVLGTRTTPVAVRAAAHGFQTGVHAITGDKRTFGYDPLRRVWVDITPAGGMDFVDLHFGSTDKGRILLGRTADAIYRFDLFPDESFVRRPIGVRIDRGRGGGAAGIAEFVPDHQVVTVAPGRFANAPTELRVPAGPGRIDVFFLIDTTSSMTAAIKGLRDGVRKIADEVVSRTHGEACFGVGEVKDFSVADNPWYGAAAVTPYKLHKKITCDLDELTAGLDALREGGGDRFPEEAQTIGLTQAVTGAGHVSPPVPPGQDAGFVAPTRVIVLITDAGFKMAPEHDGYPAMDETVKVLTSFGHLHHVVGVLLQTRNDLGPALTDLREVARRTQTFAPEWGADCDGDGFSDVDPGLPLVCKAENYAPSIAPAIVALLLGVKEPASLGVAGVDPHDVLAGVREKGAGVDAVKRLEAIRNVRVANRVPFPAVVTCRPDQDGMDLPVHLVGTKRGVVVATAEIVVQCRAPAVPRPPRRPPPPPVPPEPPPVLRPAVVPVLVPPFQPPPVNNPPPNINPNAGFSQQEEEQFQLAAVSQGASEDGELEEEIELAMSGLGPDDAAARLVLGCAALTSVAGAAAFGFRRRTQRSLRPAYARRRDR